jgi:ribonucleoside-diphosphate reductase alpha chain
VHEDLGILTPEVRARKAGEDVATGFPGGTNGGATAPTRTPSPAQPDQPGDVQPAASALTDTPPVHPARMMGLDLGPACTQCGGMMQRTGSCYTCSSCGNNTGCG